MALHAHSRLSQRRQRVPLSSSFSTPFSRVCDGVHFSDASPFSLSLFYASPFSLFLPLPQRR
jgi:hypothetical protein